jgi:hypothetical protein
MPHLKVKPLSALARLADWLMIPIMYGTAGTFNEAPQRTHRWNNIKLKAEEIDWLNPVGIVKCDGIGKKHWYEKLPLLYILFHLPAFGGWRDYVVLRPLHTTGAWYVGWRAGDCAGVSRIPLMGDVRMLLGSGDVEFFGIDAETGVQRAIQEVGRGQCGKGGPFALTPLL